jgi:peptidoglycan hydrolase-like protein with peptidoglycan-binding domain
MATAKNSARSNASGSVKKSKRSAASKQKRAAKKVASKKSVKKVTSKATTKASTKAKKTSSAKRTVSAEPKSKPTNWPLIGGIVLVGVAGLVAASQVLGNDGKSTVVDANPPGGASSIATGDTTQEKLSFAVRWAARNITREDTKTVQSQLKQLGFDPGPVDGVYGVRTAGAVLAYQAKAGLVSDGMAGSATQAKMVLDLGGKAGQLGPANPSPAKPLLRPGPVKPGPAVPGQSVAVNTAPAIAWAQKNLSKQAVVAIQTALNQKGYPAGTADGIYGAKTAAAVAQFQRDNSLTVDGLAGAITLDALIPNGKLVQASGPLLAGMGLDGCGCQVNRQTRVYSVQQ